MSREWWGDAFLGSRTLAGVAQDRVLSHVQVVATHPLHSGLISVAPPFVVILKAPEVKSLVTVIGCVVLTNRIWLLKVKAHLVSSVFDPCGPETPHVARTRLCQHGCDHPAIVLKFGSCKIGCLIVGTLLAVIIPQVKAQDPVDPSILDTNANGEAGAGTAGYQKQGQDACKSEFQANHSVGSKGERMNGAGKQNLCIKITANMNVMDGEAMEVR